MLLTNLLGGIAAVNCITPLAGFFSPWLTDAITTAISAPAFEMYFIAAVPLGGTQLPRSPVAPHHLRYHMG
ncbi:hypothetical protein [Pantoea sp. AS142]|uniref:hypothetical protein n=1 Tax=Pantoea sp. AS142 TaxID=3081292 RepID=UPI00301A9D8F